MEPTQIRLTIPDSVDPLYLTGPADSLLREIEASCAALISVRGKAIFLSGTSQEIEQLTLIFSHLIQMVESGSRPTLEDVKLLLDSTKRNASLEQTGTRTLFVTHKGKAIQPKTQGQIAYTKAIVNNSITFGIGPAGTGKTYLAVAMALAALTSQQISRIVLVRPVVEAGESLGFLPGTLQEKLDPYIRPLYDALFDMTSMEYANNLIEQGIVEIAPLAFMRGRTMNDAFVILDEAQNTTPEEMKMLRSNVDMWQKIQDTGKGNYGSRVTEKLDKYIEQAGKLQEITSSLYENLTTTTKDNVFDDFLTSLYSLADGSEKVFDEIADNWQIMVNKMAINNIVGSKFQKNLETWYENLAKINKSRATGEVTDAEYRQRLEALKHEYEEYVKSAQSDIEQLRQVGVIKETEKGGTTQQGQSGAFIAMSQDQATKLEGLFVSGQIHWANIDDHVEDVAAKMNAAQEHLRKIEENTGSSAASLKVIGDDIKKIIRDGVKIK